MERRRFEMPARISGWRLGEKLGEGSFGYVAKASRLRVDGTRLEVALKVMKRDPDSPLDLAHEFTILKRIDSPYAVKLIDSGIEENDDGSALLWLATELIRGGDLRDEVRKHGPLGREEWWQLANDLLSALDATHRAGTVHLDVKPANVMRQDGRSVLVDFGIASFVAISDPGDAGGGTPGYCSPEQVDGRIDGADLHFAADLFSAAATLVFAGIGRPPWKVPAGDARKLGAALHRVLTTEPPYLLGLDQQQIQLITPMLAVEPSKRPTAAQALDFVKHQRSAHRENSFGTAATNLSGHPQFPEQPLHQVPAAGSSPYLAPPVTQYGATSATGQLPPTHYTGTGLPGTGMPGTAMPGTAMPAAGGPATNMPATGMPGSGPSVGGGTQYTGAPSGPAPSGPLPFATGPFGAGQSPQIVGGSALGGSMPGAPVAQPNPATHPSFPPSTHPSQPSHPSSQPSGPPSGATHYGAPQNFAPQGFSGPSQGGWGANGATGASGSNHGATGPGAPGGPATYSDSGIHGAPDATLHRLRPQAAPGEGPNFFTAWLLSWLLGIFGIDRFYLGRPFSGALKLLTLGGLGIWAVLDVILLSRDVLSDGKGRRMVAPEAGRGALRAIPVISAILWLLFIPLFILTTINP
ncbi:NINE protein [Schumannella sp. 10F1B-5-1]|uniref:protein kinase domain-containing protein n=1 Tax=Schumannella sp. 10F1B-5-1 TaxID=2590780 RepID=UPI001131952B|nr:NINE protein [Schumannella sp. 10F1B-5-1]TPW73037.1 protein kinase [Schumannella sp. 10F1B-5-1]